MQDLLIIGAAVAVWYLVNRFILPRMGVQT